MIESALAAAVSATVCILRPQSVATTPPTCLAASRPPPAANGGVPSRGVPHMPCTDAASRQARGSWSLQGPLSGAGFAATVRWLARRAPQARRLSAPACSTRRQGSCPRAQARAYATWRSCGGGGGCWSTASASGCGWQRSSRSLNKSTHELSEGGCLQD